MDVNIINLKLPVYVLTGYSSFNFSKWVIKAGQFVKLVCWSISNPWIVMTPSKLFFWVKFTGSASSSKCLKCMAGFTCQEYRLYFKLPFDTMFDTRPRFPNVVQQCHFCTELPYLWFWCTVDAECELNLPWVSCPLIVSGLERHVSVKLIECKKAMFLTRSAMPLPSSLCLHWSKWPSLCRALGLFSLSHSAV